MRITRLRLRPFATKTPRRTAPPSRTRRAKACLAVGAITAFALFLGMAVAVETVKPEYRDPEYGHRLKQLCALKAANPKRPLVVAVGSSRTQMGFHPAAMGFPDEPGSPLVYNFGQSAAGPLRQLLTLLRLLDSGVTPDFVLVELFPLALAADGPAEQQLRGFVPKLGSADFRRLAPYFDDPAELRRGWASARAASWSSLRLCLLSHWKPSLLPWQKRVSFQWEQLDPRGWTPFPIEHVSDEYRAAAVERAHGEYIDRLKHFHVGAMSQRAFRDIVSRCRAEGIPVAFYLMPEGPTFRGWYTPETRAAADATVAAIARDLAPVFDATDGFAESDFSDSHHLLRGGAARFSKRLADQHVAPLVRR